MSKMFLAFFFVFYLSTMAVNSYGQIYKWVDEKGTVHFSDSPTAEVVKPQGQQTSKERTLEVVTGVETKEPSKEELLIEYLKRRDREQESIRQSEQERQERMFKAVKDQQEEMQWRRDRAADMLEKEGRKKRVVRDRQGRIIAEGITKEQQEMLRDAARLRSGSDFEGSPPPSDDVKKWERRARQAENDARHKKNAAMEAESRARGAENRARRAERDAEDAQRKARNTEIWR